MLIIEEISKDLVWAQIVENLSIAGHKNAKRNTPTGTSGAKSTKGQNSPTEDFSKSPYFQRCSKNLFHKATPHIARKVSMRSRPRHTCSQDDLQCFPGLRPSSMKLIMRSLPYRVTLLLNQ